MSGKAWKWRVDLVQEAKRHGLTLRANVQNCELYRDQGMAEVVVIRGKPAEMRAFLRGLAWAQEEAKSKESVQ